MLKHLWLKMTWMLAYAETIYLDPLEQKNELFRDFSGRSFSFVVVPRFLRQIIHD